MNRKCDIRLLFILVLAGTSCYGQSSIFRQFELGSNYQPVSINKIVQDPYGRMWLGTSRGLFAFDGADFNYRAMQDSSSQNITALFCDSSYVYLGFNDGKLARHSLKSWKKEFLMDGNLHAPITRIIVNKNGELWIATYGRGLFIRKSNQLINVTVKEGLPGDEIYAMTAAPDGKVWLGTDGGITKCELKNGKPILQTYTVDDGLTDEIVRSISADEDGNIWIGTQDKGVCILEPQSQKFTIPAFSHDWKYGMVSAIAIQGKKRAMIGTQGYGLISIALEEKLHPTLYDQSSGYENVKVSDIGTDSEGNFWVVSSNRGLDQFPALFEWVNPGNEEVTRSVQAVLYDDRSNLWFATLDGLFSCHFDSTGRDEVAAVMLRPGKKQPVITSLHSDYLHNVWVGTFDEGIFFSHEGKGNFIQFRQSNGLANDNVLSISGSGNSVWISTLGGVTKCDMALDSTGRPHVGFENFTEESGLHSSYIYQTFTDSKGRVWLATDGNGLKELDGGKFRSFEKADSLEISTVYSVTEDRNGNIWFSTPAQGIFKFDGSKFTNYGIASGISDLSITGIAADANGDILILENDAVDILELRTNQVRRYRGKPTFDNISPNLNACCRDGSGNIWIATKKGILKYYSASPKFNDEARLEIRQVMIYLEPIDFESVHAFRYNHNHLTFDFQSFWNSDPSQLRYRYMLEGHDLDWVNTKDERAIYPGLRPGTYTFKIQATIHHNFSDAPAQVYKFTISPPFWNTWWFVSACSLGGMLLIYWLINERDKRKAKDEKLKRDRIEFQLENLKSQINPHFLFNSFNTLATLVEEDQEIALSYIDHLSDFYRSLLAYKDIDLVTLEQELRLTDNYIFLLQQRHGDRLIVHRNIAESDLKLRIPPLTLQLLIENAVKHNVVSKDQPLTIELFSEEGKRICVRNNLQLKKEVQSTKFGLQNIKARSELLGSNDFEVTATDSYFMVCVPLFPGKSDK